MRESSLRVIFVGLFLFLGVNQAAAHQSDESMHVTQVRAESGEVEVEQLISISAEDLAHHFDHVGHDEFPSPAILEGAHDTFLEYMEVNTPVKADGADCKLEESKFVGYPGPDGRLHYHQLWRCPEGSGEVQLSNRVLFDMHGGGYRHMARVQVGEAITPTVFDEKFPEYMVYLKGDDEEEGAIAVAEQAQGEESSKESSGGSDGAGMARTAIIIVAMVLVIGGLWVTRRR